ncbi:hypothetical protein CCM_04024 [Cordyceps militaris CM01]|uniref:Uncharacterized protein n=1 Tax=Cordyceps militaris (strain CM01) TaxID=983644 RepID=G3JDH6_CORMM|nr:uncharacterized protein CCM_04024 [Cordyceps militaris CM01]EGX92651.1 hypothetical protein CCM_04024 [Cordyceps militaris CM01]
MASCSAVTGLDADEGKPVRTHCNVTKRPCREARYVVGGPDLGPGVAVLGDTEIAARLTLVAMYLDGVGSEKRARVSEEDHCTRVLDHPRKKNHCLHPPYNVPESVQSCPSDTTVGIALLPWVALLASKLPPLYKFQGSWGVTFIVHARLDPPCS